MIIIFMMSGKRICKVCRAELLTQVCKFCGFKEVTVPLIRKPYESETHRKDSPKSATSIVSIVINAKPECLKALLQRVDMMLLR